MQDDSGFRPVSVDEGDNVGYKPPTKKSDPPKKQSTYIGEKGNIMKEQASQVISDPYKEAHSEMQNTETKLIVGGTFTIATGLVALGVTNKYKLNNEESAFFGTSASLLIFSVDTIGTQGNLLDYIYVPSVIGKNLIKYTVGSILVDFDEVTRDPNAFKNLHPRGCDY